jgi:hypothetical protein
VATITIPPAGASVTPSAETCVATDPGVRDAYGIVSGVAPAQLAGIQFLVDPNGWLRVMLPAGPGGSAANSDALQAEIERIYRHPIENRGGVSAHRHPS